ncbi:hypothetical protein B0T17DRAFT_504260 [Bombardia bombarda]|uniref:Uncharacterized protein n=1 Tax=Bombardia bombarda TaxID=252184 RepID=A0AA40CGY4_9PEZI|nr:hypothetical protein B0T17DRAFT_504260 [Bombardia bombarda]
MQLITTLTALLALGISSSASAAAIDIETRQTTDPVLFTYNVGEPGETCGTINWYPSGISSFHQSELPASGCVVFHDWLGIDYDVKTMLVLEAPRCTVNLWSTATCSGPNQYALPSLHCGTTPTGWKSFSLTNC